MNDIIIYNISDHEIEDWQGYKFNGIIWMPVQTLSSWEMEEFEKEKNIVSDMSPTEFKRSHNKSFIDHKFGPECVDEIYQDLTKKERERQEELRIKRNAAIDNDDFFYLLDELPPGEPVERAGVYGWNEVGFAQLDSSRNFWNL
ncbi:MAG: hypothetical protein ACXADW_02950 [Candidatus Hodarchaeales archaeon]|jgi:hypothetical protein